MSSLYDTSRVKGVSCYPHLGCDSGLTPICTSLVSAQICCDMPAVSYQAMEELWFRISFCKHIGWEWPHIETQTFSGKTSAKYPTKQDLYDHVGLKTNVTKIARLAWMKKMMRRVENEVIETIELEPDTQRRM